MTKSKSVALAKFFLKARRCGAKSKRNDHQPCRQPAMKNGRCRLHGGKSTGPRTPEGKDRAARANFKHGHYTKAAIIERMEMRKMMRWRGDLDEI